MTLQDLLEQMVLETLIDETCALVAAQGVEIHQWKADEKKRTGQWQQERQERQ